MFIHRHRDRVALALGDFDRDEFVLEEAHLVGQGPSLLAQYCESILIFTGDVESAGDIFSRFSHRVGVIQLGESGIGESPADRRVMDFRLSVEGGVGLRHGEGCTAHALGAPGDVDIAAAGFDHSGCNVDRFESGGAQPIDRAAGHTVGESGQQGGHSSHVSIVFTRLVGGSEVDIGDRGWIHTRLFDHRLDDVGGEIIRSNGGESPSIATKWRSEGGDDGCAAFWHGWSAF